jgi:hypothetical protein
MGQRSAAAGLREKAEGLFFGEHKQREQRKGSGCSSRRGLGHCMHEGSADL